MSGNKQNEALGSLLAALLGSLTDHDLWRIDQALQDHSRASLNGSLSACAAATKELEQRCQTAVGNMVPGVRERIINRAKELP